MESIASGLSGVVQRLALASPFYSSRLGRCWICGNAPNSREHKVKRSEFARLYGEGPYREKSGNLVGHVTDRGIRTLQSPNDGKLKYEASLCVRCNSAFSQPFDISYDKISAWLNSNRERVLTTRIVDLSEVFTEAELNEGALGLFRYFCKSFGCQLVANGIRVPWDVRLPLFRDHFQTRLRITLAVNTSVFYFGEPLLSQFIGIGRIRFIKTRRDKLLSAAWHQQLGWLRIGYWYQQTPWPRHGAAWTCSDRVLYLGDIESATHETLAAIPHEDKFYNGDSLVRIRDALCAMDAHEQHFPTSNAGKVSSQDGVT